MRPLIILGFSVCFVTTFTIARGLEQKCPAGTLTKATPSPENDLKACKNYACNSCCTSEVTQELALVPLQVVGIINYTQCGPLSEVCSQYMSYVQCFYQCSPNLYPWLSDRGHMQHLPLCGSFCDEWFNACAGDRTCVETDSWVRGFAVTTNAEGKKVGQCKTGTTCRNYTAVYINSVNFCNSMWANAVQYVKDGDNNCMNPANPEHNEDVVKAKAGDDAPFTICDDVTYIDTGAIIGIVIGTLTAVAFICGGILWYVRNKTGAHAAKGKSASAKNTAPAPKEMEELNPEPSD